MMIERVAGMPVRTMLSRGTMGAMLAALVACGSLPKPPERAEAEEDKYTDRLQISNLAGFLQTAPDEFSVITKRPLEMPRDFAALPVPEPGKPSTRDPDPLADARAALAFDPVPASGRTAPVAVQGTLSATEAAILSAAGPIDPDIRAAVANDQATYEAEQNVYLLDRIFPSLRRGRGDFQPEALDAEEERQRLLEAGIVSGRAPVAVATPVPVQMQPSVVAPAPVQAPVAVTPQPIPALIVAAPADTSGLIFLPE